MSRTYTRRSTTTICMYNYRDASDERYDGYDGLCTVTMYDVRVPIRCTDGARMTAIWCLSTTVRMVYDYVRVLRCRKRVCDSGVICDHTMRTAWPTVTAMYVRTDRTVGRIRRGRLRRNAYGRCVGVYDCLRCGVAVVAMSVRRESGRRCLPELLRRKASGLTGLRSATRRAWRPMSVRKGKCVPDGASDGNVQLETTNGDGADHGRWCWTMMTVTVSRDMTAMLTVRWKRRNTKRCRHDDE